MRKSDSFFTGACAVPKYDKKNDRVVMRRLAALSYIDDNESDSGSALSSISAAAATLGSAYILSRQPNNAVNVPTRTIPAYGAATPVGGGMLFALVAVIGLGIFGLFWALKG